MLWHLAEALAAGKKIVVCTIQTFPFALEEVRKLTATEGKRFAVIADEAHSSQTGEAAAKLKQVLSPEEIADLSDGGEVSTEDILAAQMVARASDKGVTYVAFTATPKPKTVELFGRRPNPDQPAGPSNLPAAFHVYSMRQTMTDNPRTPLTRAGCAEKAEDCRQDARHEANSQHRVMLEHMATNWDRIASSIRSNIEAAK